jgi:hypothetical protein
MVRMKRGGTCTRSRSRMQHCMALSIFTRSQRTCRAQLVGVATVAVLATLPLAAAFSAIRNVEIIHKTVGQVGRVHLLPLTRTQRRC